MSGGASGSEVKAALDAEQEPPELRVSGEREPLYRAWVLEALLMRAGGLTADEAIYGGAETIQISTVTARRYLRKMLNASSYAHPAGMVPFPAHARIWNTCELAFEPIHHPWNPW